VLVFISGIALEFSHGLLDFRTTGANGAQWLGTDYGPQVHIIPLGGGRHNARRPDGCASRSSFTLDRSSASRVTQHVIRQAVAVARLIGVPAPVHVSQIEHSNGLQRPA
jgi:hypothetical protein